MTEPLLTVNEAAAWLGVTRCTIYRLCAKQGGLRSYKVAGCVRFKPEDLDEYLDRHLVQPPQPHEDSNVIRFQYKPGMRVVSL